MYYNETPTYRVRKIISETSFFMRLFFFSFPGCFFMYMFTIGSLKSYGVLYTELTDYFGAGSGATAWIGSVCSFLLLGLGPFSNWMSIKFSFRRVTFIGGVFTGIGYVTSSFIPRIEYLYVTFGVLAGKEYVQRRNFFYWPDFSAHIRYHWKYKFRDP